MPQLTIKRFTRDLNLPICIYDLSTEKGFYELPLTSTEPIPVFYGIDTEPYMFIPAFRDATGKLITFTHNGGVEISLSKEKQSKPDLEESLDELIIWFTGLYTKQMVNGSNINLKQMQQNLAIIQDAISSYRTWREMNKPKELE